MKIAFRVEANPEIGLGHLMRCLALADILADTGACCHFLSYGDVVRDRVAERHVFHSLPDVPIESFGDIDTETKGAHNYAHWLPGGWRADAAACLDVLTHIGRVDWLVVDHYAIDALWEVVLNPHVGKLMCIDDLANRDHVCDLLVDQNLYPAPERRYAGRLPPAAKTLLGPRFALLRPEFLQARQHLQERDGSVRRIFLFMGGGDAANVTGAVLDALSLSLQVDLAIDVVVGDSNPHVADLQTRCARLPHVQMHRQASNMAELMLAADLAIGAAGVSTWERAALGLPTLVVTLAQNQRDIARYADEAGLLSWLGNAKTISGQGLARHIDKACASADVLRRQSLVGLAIVDARGGLRVAEAMR